MTIALNTAVERLIKARATCRTMAPLSEEDAGLTVEWAYEIQAALQAELERRGERAIGWKLGATSQSGRAVMGVKEPTSGFLLPQQYMSGADVPLAAFASLGVEAEVAFRMRTELAGPGVTADAAGRAAEGALAALELPDFIFSGKPTGPDFIANSVHARAIVLGSPVTPLAELGLDLAREGVVCEHNGEIVGTHTAAEVMGNPVNALAWLANHLAARGLSLKPGDLVMSGSISKMLRPKAGDTIRARFTRLGSVACRFV
jgi:2-keto-4-pentenoate hydratase